MSIVTKGVSFNVNDPDQKALLKHALKTTNFSAYIKRLIQRDMDSKGVRISGAGIRYELKEGGKLDS